MPLGVRSLLSLATILALAAAAMTLMAARPDDVAAALSTISQAFRAAFEVEPWRPLLPLTAAVCVASLALVAIERILGGPAGPGAAGALSGSLRERLDEASKRIKASLDVPKPRVIEGFNELIRGAIAVQASDIHLSPSREALTVTYRVDGQLHEVIKLPAALAPRLSIRAKVLAGLDTQSRPMPQDGRLVAHLDGNEIDARMSTLPTETGERVVLRLVSGSRSLPTVDDLGYRPDLTARLREVVERAQGLFFVTGVVGSGKTTTLYAMLHDISKRRGRTTSIVTLEDPVELQLPFAVQTRINPKTGTTFATSLRSVLRQDPNVLMVGEIRDRETADIAVQASLTGHLILTTVHSDTAAGPFARLAELEVEPFLTASAAIGCLSQRLVRKLCTACRREAVPDAIIVDTFARHEVALPPGPYYEATGCDYCEHLGFSGRAPITELLLVDEELRKAIHDRRPTNEIHRLAVAHGMTSLIADGVARARGRDLARRGAAGGRMSLRAAIAKLSAAGQWLAALLLVLLFGRFAFVSGSAAFAEVEPVHVAPSPPPPAPVASAGAPAPAEEPEPTGTPIRVMVLVKHRDSRTQVLVDGSFVGNAPYAGDLTCIPGETLTFQIVPPDGETITRTRKCIDDSITISE